MAGDATGYLVRIELRRRWRSVVLLTLLTALVVGTALASLAGAGQARSSYERYLAFVDSPDAGAFGDPAALGDLGDLEAVETAVPMELVSISPEIDPGAFFPMVATEGTTVPYERFRAPVVQGRAPAPTEPLEIALGERTARRLHVRVGDELPMDSWSPEATAALDASSDPEPDGPALVFDVVGIVRDAGDIGGRLEDITLTFLTPAFRARYGPEVIGSFAAGSLLFVRDGHTLAEVSDALQGQDVELDTSLSAESRQQVAPTMDAIGTALRVFAAVAAIAGLGAFAQAAVRMHQVSSSDDRTLAALGVSGWERWARLVVPGAGAVLVGTALGLVIAALASPLLPVGLARRADPDLGFHLHTTVLLVGGAASLVVGWGVVGASAAWRARHTTPAVIPVGISSWGRAAANAGAAPSVVSGLALAGGTPGRPGRAAVAGTLLGVLGVVAALIYGASLERLRSDPALYGWGWDAVIEGADASDLRPGAFDPSEALADDDVVVAGTVVMQLPLTVDGAPHFAMTTTDMKGHLQPILVRGALPAGPDELAVGRDTLRQIDATLGDTVDVAIGSVEQPMRVTGVVAFPVPEDGGSSASGVYLPSGAERLDLDGVCEESDSCFRNLALRLRDGIDPQVIAKRYTDLDAGVDVQFPRPPGEIERLTAVEHLPQFLAGFLALLAAVAVSFATATTVRRRRADLAVLRVLGMTARQLRTVVTVVVMALTVAGAAAGAAAGVLVGRQVWRAVATGVSLPFAPSLPIAAMVLVPLVAILLGQVVATATRRAAGRTAAAVVLRTE